MKDIQCSQSSNNHLGANCYMKKNYINIQEKLPENLENVTSFLTYLTLRIPELMDMPLHSGV